MMARFISMPIGSDTALNIMCSRNVIRQLYCEQFIQPVAEPDLRQLRSYILVHLVVRTRYIAQ